MQVFTYAKTGSALRSHVIMLLTLLMADIVTFAVVALLVPGYWKAVVALGGAAMLAVAVWALTRSLRTAHELDDRELRLRVGSFRAVIDRATVESVRLFAEPIARGIAVPTLGGAQYHPDSDTLYLLADKRRLVELSLAQPASARAWKLGKVQFRRLVMSLDEPQTFLAAFTPVTDTTGTVSGKAVTIQDATRPVPASAPLWTSTADPLRPAPPAIHLGDLVRRFGSFTAVGGISLQVRPGEVLAFLGANGAGKTTTIRMMTGLLRPTSGRVLIGGHDLWAGGPEVRRQVGYVPDVPLL